MHELAAEGMDAWMGGGMDEFLQNILNCSLYLIVILFFGEV